MSFHVGPDPNDAFSCFCLQIDRNTSTVFNSIIRYLQKGELYKFEKKPEELSNKKNSSKHLQLFFNYKALSNKEIVMFNKTPKQTAWLNLQRQLFAILSLLSAGFIFSVMFVTVKGLHWDAVTISPELIIVLVDTA